MYASVRRYTSFDRSDAAMQDLISGVNGEFVPLLSSQPGFVSYQLVIAPDRSSLVTVSKFEGEREAEASATLAREWVARRLAHLVSGAPVVTSGEVLARASVAVPA